MRIPEPLFVVINPAMRLTLRSPLHFMFSYNIMLIRYRGRKTGKHYEIPVRYIEDSGVVKCFTDKRSGWWPNLRDNDNVELLLRGKSTPCQTSIVIDEPERLEQELNSYLNKMPADAVYHDVRLDHDRKPCAEDIAKSALSTVMVIAKRL